MVDNVRRVHHVEAVVIERDIFGGETIPRIFTPWAAAARRHDSIMPGETSTAVTRAPSWQNIPRIRRAPARCPRFPALRIADHFHNEPVFGGGYVFESADDE